MLAALPRNRNFGSGPYQENGSGPILQDVIINTNFGSGALSRKTVILGCNTKFWIIKNEPYKKWNYKKRMYKKQTYKKITDPDWDSDNVDNDSFNYDKARNRLLHSHVCITKWWRLWTMTVSIMTKWERLSLLGLN